MKYYNKKIALFLSHIFGRFQTELCQGVVDQAKKYGYRVEIYPSTDGEDVGSYGAGEESILKIPDYHRFHGVIFASGTYLSQDLRHKITNRLKESCTCPVLEICNDVSVFPKLSLDNNSVFQMLAEHFITVHRKNRICFLGSSDHAELSALRQTSYQKAMHRHGLKILPQNIISCPETPEGVKEALNTFLKNADCIPDAILCYNDDMALSLIGCIFQTGLRVPEDLAVAGCDDLPFGRESSPQLTTISFPIRQLGQKAVDLLRDTFSGTSLPPDTQLMAEPIYRASCGCPPKSTQHSFFLPAKLVSKINSFENSLIQDIRMSAELHRVTDLDTGINLLEEYIRRLEYLSEFYLCLYSDWNRIPGEIRQFVNASERESESDIMLLKFALRKGKRLPECSFIRQNVLPEYLYAKSDAHFIYQPLYFESHAFGYLAISYENDEINYPFIFISWLRNLNSMLENICHIQHMGFLVDKLNSLYNHDELTGLYNRRSFLCQMESALSNHAESGQTVLLMRIDIDSLHVINETFGRAEGNFALRVVGHAIENAASPQIICGRTGGDTFYIFASDYSDEKAVKLRERIDRYLDNYNKLHTKHYLISVTAGYILVRTDQIKDLDSIFCAADQKLRDAKEHKSCDILKI